MLSRLSVLEKDVEIRLEDFTTPLIKRVEDFSAETVNIWLIEHNGFRSSGDIHIDASFSRSNVQVLMQAKMTGQIIGVCSRCLEDALINIDTDITIMFLPNYQERRYKEDEKIELRGEELDVEYYKGNRIEVDYLFREELLLAIPFSPLCSEECKGLCPVCGGNLNKVECTCSHQKSTSNDIKLNFF